MKGRVEKGMNVMIKGGSRQAQFLGHWSSVCLVASGPGSGTVRLILCMQSSSILILRLSMFTLDDEEKCAYKGQDRNVRGRG